VAHPFDFKFQQLTGFPGSGGPFHFQFLNAPFVGARPFLHGHFQFIQAVRQLYEFRDGDLLRLKQFLSMDGQLLGTGFLERLGQTRCQFVLGRRQFASGLSGGGRGRVEATRLRAGVGRRACGP
jgi:hypothetical protein